MKYYTLTAIVNGREVKLKRNMFLTRSDAINYMFDYYEKNNIYTYDIGFEALIESDVYKDVKNAPNCIIVKKGKVYTFYYDESDDDLEIIKSKEATASWIQKYILLK